MTDTTPIRCPPRQASPTWTHEEEERLRALVAQDLSAAQIAMSFPGRSRNAILGKAHRLRMRVNGKHWPLQESFWDRDGNLRKLVDYYNSPMGYSNPEIAGLLGCGMGTLSRGLGRMRANGQIKAKTKPHPAERVVPKRYRPRTAAARAAARAAHPPMADVTDDPTATSITIAELKSSSCRWPVEGHGHDMRYCGCVAIPGIPYCGPHARRAYAS
jgi:GcrA cell cycle regulator